MNEEDNYLDETIINETNGDGLYCKAALMMNDSVKFGKSLCQISRDGKIVRRTVRYNFALDANALGKAFYDAYIMTYLPNITKRYQDPMENDVIEDISGNKIKFVFDNV